jgi:hypothetical protein
MDNLLKEAIADAKAVRETALANAKIALEEAFTPKLQRMLSAKLAQEDGEPEAAEDEDLEEQGDPEAMEDTSELPAEESDDDNYEENEVGDGMSEDDVEDSSDEDEEAMGDTSQMGEGEEAEEDEDLEEDEEPVEDEVPAEEDEEAYEDDELDLEAIIRELEADAEEDEEPVEEQSDSSDIGEDDNVVEPAEGDDEEKDETDDSSSAPGEENEDDEVVDDLEEQEDGEEAEEDEEPLDLESIIKELEDEMEDEEAEEDEEPAEESAKAKLAKVNADLAEHRKVVRYLSSKLHEVNLLNAKLLYTNKLFRAHSLKENQKLRVIETFDRAKNLREVKLVFTTMAESFGSTPGKKRRMTENVASRPTASTKPSRKVITEGQVLANRFKKLAGIK